MLKGLLTAAACAAALAGAAHADAEPVRTMTFNIRFGTAPDGENAWPHRREMVLRVIREFDPDVLGVQEALREQVDELAAAFPHLAAVGVGRQADGGGEYSALFYRRTRFDLWAADTFWLSDDPKTPGSHTWGNDLARICTWARLFDRTSGRPLWAFNTHWDHVSQASREKSGALMAHRIAAVPQDEPVVVTGDLNAGERNPAVTALTDGGAVLVDAYREVRPDEPEAGTFHGFSGKPGAEKIDFVFYRGSGRVSEAEIVRSHEGTRYPSDHFPVTATIEFSATP